jgi:hypothetical protein
MIDLNLKQLIDKPDTTDIRPLDRIVCELSKYMTPLEIDACVDYMDLTHDSKFDVNLTVGDAAEQMKLILGRERYEYIKMLWSKNNSHLINGGRTKYVHKSTGAIYDGLDPDDNPLDYDAVTM